MLRFSLMAAVLCSAIWAVGVQDAVKLSWTPTAGEPTKYKGQAEFKLDMGQGEQNFKYSFVLKRKVTSVLPDRKVKVEKSVGEQTLLVDDQDMSQVVEGMAYSTTYTYLPNGEIAERKMAGPDEMDNPRLDDAEAFVFPEKELKVGETWTRATKADSSKGRVATSTTYTFQGIEEVGGVKARKIGVSFKELEGEHPMTNEGTVWLSEAGEPLKVETTLTNIVFAEGVPMVKAKMTLQKV